MAHRHLDEDDSLRAWYLDEQGQRPFNAFNTDLDLPEAFWTRQRAEILSARPQPRRRWIAVAAMAVIILIACFALRPTPQVAVAHGISAADEQLLNDVNTSVTRVAPTALSPIDPFLGGGQ